MAKRKIITLGLKVDGQAGIRIALNNPRFLPKIEPRQIFTAAYMKQHDMPEEALTAIWFATELVKRQGESTYIRIARKLFTDQEKETVANIPKVFTGLKSAGKGSFDFWKMSNLLDSFYDTAGFVAGQHGDPWLLQPAHSKQDLESALAIFDLNKWYKETVKRFGPSVAESVVQGYVNGLDQLNLDDLDFPDDDPRAVAMAAEVLNKTKGINDTIVKDLSNLIPQAIEQGADIDQLTDLVENVFGVARNRAKTIAQTTATPVFEEGQTMAFQDAGILERSWLSRRDGKVRTGKYDHLEPDGQVVAITAKFLVSGEFLRFAGDPSGSAGNVINCRCTQKPVI